ncbi:MAG: hypothetical protein L0207_02710 [Chlamydiae bacterium]|nr:hypothetical protein [Chlamydiota bacterium]
MINKALFNLTKNRDDLNLYFFQQRSLFPDLMRVFTGAEVRFLETILPLALIHYKENIGEKCIKAIDITNGALSACRTGESLYALKVSWERGSAWGAGHNSLQASLAIISLAAWFFARPLALTLTVSGDIVRDLYGLKLNIQATETNYKYKEIAYNILNLCRHLSYLGYIATRSKNLAIAGMAFQHIRYIAILCDKKPTIEPLGYCAITASIIYKYFAK